MGCSHRPKPADAHRVTIRPAEQDPWRRRARPGGGGRRRITPTPFAPGVAGGSGEETLRVLGVQASPARADGGRGIHPVVSPSAPTIRAHGKHPSPFGRLHPRPQGAGAGQATAGLYPHRQPAAHHSGSVDNAADEALAGFGKKIIVARRRFGQRGDRPGISACPEEQAPVVELVFTRPRRQQVRQGQGRRLSGSLHGVGVSVTNALSSGWRSAAFATAGGAWPSPGDVISRWPAPRGEGDRKQALVRACPDAKYRIGRCHERLVHLLRSKAAHARRDHATGGREDEGETGSTRAACATTCSRRHRRSGDPARARLREAGHDSFAGRRRLAWPSPRTARRCAATSTCPPPAGGTTAAPRDGLFQAVRLHRAARPAPRA